MSKITDYKDRSTCILFGDGAGVILIEAQEDTKQADLEPMIIASHFTTDGSGGLHVYRSGLSQQMNGRPWQEAAASCRTDAKYTAGQ